MGRKDHKKFENSAGKLLQLKFEIQKIEQRISDNKKTWSELGTKIRKDGQLKKKMFDKLLDNIN
jgi:cell division protein FtsL